MLSNRYYKLGNAGFISYSGGHSYDAMEAYFEEACAYLTSSNVQAVMLMGHWNTPGLGCSSDMNVPATYKELLQLPVCQALEGKMRYFEGHTHCNTVVEENVGFMVSTRILREKRAGKRGGGEESKGKKRKAKKRKGKERRKEDI